MADKASLGDERARIERGDDLLADQDGSLTKGDVRLLECLDRPRDALELAALLEQSRSGTYIRLRKLLTLGLVRRLVGITPKRFERVPVMTGSDRGPEDDVRLLPTARPPTRKEMDILSALNCAMTAAEIAEAMSISTVTARAHMARLERKGMVRRDRSASPELFTRNTASDQPLSK